MIDVPFDACLYLIVGIFFFFLGVALGSSLMSRGAIKNKTISVLGRWVVF